MLIDDVYSGGTQEDGDYMLLSQAMELGLYHPNCRHGSDTYYREREEFFEKYYKSHPELDNPLSETAADDYGEHNEAHIDNMIQRYSRLVAGSVDKENIANYQLLLDKWLDKKSAVVDKSGESGIITSGAISGALDPNSEDAYEHAERYYELVRNMSTDAQSIAHNTGFDIEDIQKVKDFIFFDIHDLGDGDFERFYPSYDMAQSWQRLIDGKNIQPHDVTLIKHELYECDLMNAGVSQKIAHIEASKKHNYKKECDEFNAKTNKHKNDK